MTILHSAEVRWVISGLVPGGIKNWFENDPNCRNEETRMDYYLKFIGDQFIGIKLRKYESGLQKLEKTRGQSLNCELIKNQIL